MMFSWLKRSLFFLSAIAILTGCSQPESLLSEIEPNESEAATAVRPSQAVSYDSYASLLSQYVNDQGLVAYQELQANRQPLDKFNRSLGEVAPETFLNWSEEEQIAFLMNAYNSYTLAAIINQDPLKDSIRDIPQVWKKAQYLVVGQNKSLDGIEHGTLRQDYNEPRLHAALVCAAISCPPLRNEPYRGDRLDTQLDDQVTAWLSNPQSGLKIDRQNNTVSISAIFDWYGQDWIPDYGTDEGFTGNEKQRAVLNFISNYVSAEDAEYLREGNYRVKYLDYDWSLNIQSNG
ncbi:MAG: DUF547 domain-containing protein [Cyanophyceae cyanobacterium]